MAPALGNRPSVHLLDVKFDSCVGNNVLCVSPNVDLQRTYSTVFNKSDAITSFMGVSCHIRNMFYFPNAFFYLKLSVTLLVPHNLSKSTFLK